MSNPLSTLKIDHWWHAFTVIGAAGLIASVAIEPKHITQRTFLLLFLSFFLFGVGQWINHPIQVALIPRGKLTGYPRTPSPLGVSLELMACVLFTVALVFILISK